MRELTPRIALELIAHEGIVTEAYKDSVGVWTWSVGITDASGHKVFPRYKDKPQPLEHCIGVYLWLLREKYLPPVLAAFGPHDPTEAELGAALSFHWNTGAIARASWIGRFVKGDVDGARKAMLDWARPASLLPRRRKEQALFFDGRWSEDGTALVYGVAKPSYRPSGGKRVQVRALVEGLFADQPVPAPAVAEKKTWFDRLFE
ncbi:lysozyme [Novosphingobium sp. ERN07]|uniref:lysozyme n=1 Tax=Novosphingobium sp. ERN07 TaxID=2726187 RepID=UPI0014573900|nr:lysozyme [Novosphingobium sp. ERN07]NLR69821.1 lysozyme [Novosphingobium sp. ERN07]